MVEPATLCDTYIKQLADLYSLWVRCRSNCSTLPPFPLSEENYKKCLNRCDDDFRPKVKDAIAKIIDCVKGTLRSLGVSQGIVDGEQQAKLSLLFDPTENKKKPTENDIEVLNSNTVSSVYTSEVVVIDNWWTVKPNDNPCSELWKNFYTLKDIYKMWNCSPVSDDNECRQLTQLMLELADAISDCIAAEIGRTSREGRALYFVPPLPNDPSVPGAWGSEEVDKTFGGARFLTKPEDALTIPFAEFAPPPGGGGPPPKPIEPQKPYRKMPDVFGCADQKPVVKPSPGNLACCEMRIHLWWNQHPIQKQIEECAKRTIQMDECKSACDLIIIASAREECKRECENVRARSKPSLTECARRSGKLIDIGKQVEEALKQCQAFFGDPGGAAGGGVSSVAPPVLPSVKYPRKLDNGI